jgi:hypothetical protein
MRFKGIKGKDSRFLFVERVCRGMGILFLDLIKEIGGISPSLFIKNHLHTRVILFVLCLLSRIPFSRLPFKDQERLAARNSIRKDRDL